MDGHQLDLRWGRSRGGPDKEERVCRQPERCLPIAVHPFTGPNGAGGYRWFVRGVINFVPSGGRIMDYYSLGKCESVPFGRAVGLMRRQARQRGVRNDVILGRGLFLMSEVPLYWGIRVPFGLAVGPIRRRARRREARLPPVRTLLAPAKEPLYLSICKYLYL